MNKLKWTTVAVALLALAGPASAGPIELQIGGSELEVEGFGFGDYDYYDNSMGNSVLLDEGDSFFFNFGFVDVSDFALAKGMAKLTIELLSPTPNGEIGELGRFVIGAAFDSGWVDLDWGNAVSFGYSYGGVSGGILSLNMFDVYGHYDDGIELEGKITNVRSPGSPVSVPEPGLLLLLGSGLLALAGMRRLRT